MLRYIIIKGFEFEFEFEVFDTIMILQYSINTHFTLVDVWGIIGVFFFYICHSLSLAILQYDGIQLKDF